MLATLQCAAILPKQFKCQASGSAAKRLPHWVQLYRHQAGWAAECTQSIENRRWFDTPSWRLDSARSSSGNVTGVAQWSQEQDFNLASLLPCRKNEKVNGWNGGEGQSARRWSFWQAERDLWCGPSYSLGWDKSGSVAPLRLVGCLIETPARSWAYFYSTFLLPFSPFCCTDLSL